MEKRSYLERCQLVDLRLLKSSSDLDPDLRPKKLSLSLRQELKFERSSGQGAKGFYLDLDSELTGSGADESRYFVVNTKFRADYAIVGDNQSDVEKFQTITELLGNQISPVVRSFMTTLLTAMGISLPLPLPAFGTPASPPRKSRSRKKSEGIE